MPTNPSVVLHSDGPLAVITLTAPPLNLFDQALIDGLTEAVQSVAGDPLRGLLFRAEGRAVSGGWTFTCSTV
jgi:enoyl-CoA hydratase/carnithine racemase